MKLTTKTIHERKLPMGVLDLDVSPDGETAYAACMDGVYRVDVQDGQVERLGRHASYVSGVALLHERQQLVTAGYDGVLIWHDLAAGEWIRQVRAHDFWSWRMAVSPDLRYVASVTGQYLAGGEKYEPAPEREPSVRVFGLESGAEVACFPHVPPVQSVAFSPDGRHLAAGNLMGELRVWNLPELRQVAQWTTPDFTSWGIIKSHCYLGGIFDVCFTPDGQELLATGMGPMRDPMAGNGKQTWQRFAWREQPPKKTAEFHGGEGLMETLAFHPTEQVFVMAGRLRGGQWNVALFDALSGELIHHRKAGFRVTKAVFDASGSRLYLAGAQGQPGPKEGEFPHFGRLEVLQL